MVRLAASRVKAIFRVWVVIRPRKSFSGAMRALIAVLAVIAVDFPSYAADLGTDWTWKAVGYARIIDGDTIERERPELAFCPPPKPCPEGASERVRRIKVRLYGIDSPELN